MQTTLQYSYNKMSMNVPARKSSKFREFFRLDTIGYKILQCAPCCRILTT